MSNNPLLQFQVHESVFVTLPTLGLYYDNSIIDFDCTQEIGVKPMSAKDEMLLNNPDALMNGRAITSIISNCVPQVKKPLDLVVSDIEALLLAIKRASGDETYDINTACPSCQAKGVFERDIDEVLSECSYHTQQESYILPNGVIIFIKPNSWSSHSKIQQIAFKQQKLTAIAKSPDLPDQQKIEIFRAVFDDMLELNVQLVCDCIHYVETPAGDKITDNKFIREYIDTFSKEILDALQLQVEEVNNIGIPKTMEVACPSCNHEWTLENLRFDPSYFFVQSSSSQLTKK